MRVLTFSNEFCAYQSALELHQHPSLDSYRSPLIPNKVTNMRTNMHSYTHAQARAHTHTHTHMPSQENIEKLTSESD